MRRIKPRLRKWFGCMCGRSQTSEQSAGKATGGNTPASTEISNSQSDDQHLATTESPLVHIDRSHKTGTVDLLPDEQPRASEHQADCLPRLVDNTVQEAVEIESDPSSLTIPERPTQSGISLYLWNRAYDSVKEKEPELVETYEKILSQQIVEEGAALMMLTTVNQFANCTGQVRFGRMKSVVLRSVQKLEKHEGMREGIIGITTFVANINSIVGSMLGPYPPAAMAWAGVCTILPVLTSPFVADKVMVEGLEHVISRMDWYMNLSSTLLENSWKASSVFLRLRDNLEQKIISLYGALLDYEMRGVVYCYHDRPIAKSMKSMLGFNDWEGRKKDIETLEEGFDKDLTQFGTREIVQHLRDLLDSTRMLSEIAKHVSQISEQQRLLQTEEVQRQRAERRRHQSHLTGRFKTTNYEERMRFNPDHVPGTCEWFQKHEKYRQWQTEINGLLLVSADPGCGKSVLARYLVEKVLPSDDPAATVCYFFFKDNPEQRSLSNALCALLHRIFYENSSLAEHCEKQITTGGPNLHSDSTALWRIFEKAISHREVNPVICVLDALDECDPDGRRILLPLLRSFLRSSTSTTRVKFLVTTRGYPVILEEFQDFGSASIHLSGDNKEEKQQIQREINLVVNDRLDKFSAKRRLSSENRNLIREALRNVEAEQRTYLWAKLVFEALEKNREDDEAAWEKLFRNIPETVFQAYENLLARVNEEEEDRVRVLLNLVIAAERPLTLREMNIALKVRDRIGSYSEDQLRLASDENFRGWLLETCGFFVTEYDGCIFFIHQTAKEFLLANSDKGAIPKSNLSSRWQNLVTISQAHRSMVESCIAYLSLEVFTGGEFRKEISKLVDRARRDSYWTLARIEQSSGYFSHFRFLGYSLRYWLAHFRSAQEFEGKAVKDIDAKFDDCYFSLFTNHFPWLVIFAAAEEKKCHYKLTQYDADGPGPSVTVASLAALIGHLRLFQQHERKNRDETGDKTFDVPRVPGISSYLDDDWRMKGRRLKFDKYEIPVPETHYQPIFFAAAGGHPHIIECVPSDMINARDGLQRTPLHTAAIRGHYSVLKLLFERGADVNATDQDGCTVLHCLVYYENRQSRSFHHCRNATNFADSVRYLILKGLEYGEITYPSWVDDFNCANFESLLHFTARIGDEDFPELRAIESSKQDQTAIHVELSARSFQKVYERSFIKFLIDKGEDPNSKGERGNTPLHLAGTVGNVLFLLQSNADINAKNDDGDTPLHRAARNNPTIVALLLEKKAAVSTRNKNGATPLHIAAKSQRPKAVSLLLQSEADVTVRDDEGSTPLHLAARSRDLQAVALLLQSEADVTVRDDEGNTPLHIAAVQDAKVVALLIQSKADVNAQNDNGDTPLHIAARDCPSAVACLLKHGADAKMENKVRQIALHGACLFNRAAAAEMLIKADKGAANTKDENGTTPLMLASIPIIGGGCPALKLLLKHNAEINVQDNRGWSALHNACLGYNVESVKVLLEAGADIEMCNHEKQTPLHIACELSDTSEIVRVLLEYHADINKKDKQGFTALHHACEVRREDVMKLLVEKLVSAGADIETLDAEYHLPPDILGHFMARGNEED